MPYDAQGMNACFSASYAEGRKKFLDACAKAGLSVTSHMHPDALDASGQALAMDATWIGPKDAAKVFVMTCGTHGLEGAAGSATMVQFLLGGGADTLPPDCAMFLVHAVNPYGWAHDSRGNEDNIDLNRNFVAPNEPRPDNPDYEAIHKALVVTDARPSDLEDFLGDVYAFAQSQGLAAAMNGITAGQYAHEDGISYGGKTESWSAKTLYALIRAHLAKAQKIVWLDWHTGIGDHGQPFFILDDPVGSYDHDTTSRFWPEYEMHTDEILDGVMPEYTGLLLIGVKREILSLNPDAKVAAFVVEWGTYEPNSMIQALVMDNWLRRPEGKNADPLVRENARTRLVERFYPSQPEWRASVLAHARRIYEGGLIGLTSL